MEGFNRTCPQCGNTVTHKSKAKRNVAVRLNKICVTCSRSNTGKRNSKTDSCPICNETFAIPWALNESSKAHNHAASHKLTLEQLWLKKHGQAEPQKCRCGCGSATKWAGWWQGYSEFVIGHNANIYAIYDDKKAREIIDKRREKLIGHASWAKGLTKETDERIRKRAEATSIGRKAAFDEGKITAWSKGLTKETDERVKAAAENLTEQYSKGMLVPWAKGLSKETDSRIAAMAMKVSIAHTSNGIRQRLDEAKRLNIDTITGRIEENSTLRVVDIGDYKNDASNSIEVRCDSCGSTFFSSLRRLQHGRCWTCDPHGSAAQSQIAAFIRDELNIPVTQNDRNVIKGEHRMAELDIYVPSCSFAVEYNGLYWHCDLHKSNSYHENKTRQCEETQIRLMHIFQDEWSDKQEIVKSMIRNRLGVTPNKMNARSTNTEVLTPKQKKQFFNANHIDGDTASTVTFGLVCDGDIVAALSLRKPFHKRHKGSIEVARMCTLINTNVRGGLSKLTKHAKAWASENGYGKLLSYVDTRHGAGKGWETAGFKFIDRTAPRFWWTNFTGRFNRFRYKADKSRGMSEAQIAEEAGVTKIWGCGNIIYETQL